MAAFAFSLQCLKTHKKIEWAILFLYIFAGWPPLHPVNFSYLKVLEAPKSSKKRIEKDLCTLRSMQWVFVLSDLHQSMFWKLTNKVKTLYGSKYAGIFFDHFYTFCNTPSPMQSQLPLLSTLVSCTFLKIVVQYVEYTYLLVLLPNYTYQR